MLAGNSQKRRWQLLEQAWVGRDRKGKRYWGVVQVAREGEELCGAASLETGGLERRQEVVSGLANGWQRQGGSFDGDSLIMLFR